MLLRDAPVSGYWLRPLLDNVEWYQLRQDKCRL